MKNTLTVCLLSLCLIGLTVVPSVAAEWTFTRKIDVIIPHGEGGGVDTTARALGPFLEKELGVPVVFTNMTGANGLTGTAFMNKQPADGYTFAIISPSPLIAAVLGAATYDFMGETQVIACVVHDVNILWVKADAPYNSWKDFEDYAKANPGQLTVSVSTLIGNDGASLIPLFREAGLQDAVTLIGYAGAEPTVAVLSGESTATVGTYTDVGKFMVAGELKPLIAITDKRTSSLPDVPTSVELGYNVTSGPFRFFICKKGTPQGAVEAMEGAIERVSKNPDWIAWMTSNGLTDRPGFRNTRDMTALWNEFSAQVKELFGEGTH